MLIAPGITRAAERHRPRLRGRALPVRGFCDRENQRSLLREQDSAEEVLVQLHAEVPGNGPQIVVLNGLAD